MSATDLFPALVETAGETHALAAALAATLRGGEIIALHGPLGAGKTEFTRGLARALGYRGDVTSPTFSLVHEYPGARLPLCHLDLYRVETVEEARRFGVEDYLDYDEGRGVAVVEWPERIAPLLPASTLHLTIEPLPDGRRRFAVGASSTKEF
ncbi:tRNA threonylcarbamoyladenosine biosynthesis protein TsaE [Verrucomicrobium sp. GAS474]|uniref:tRNA (adenosine(37)-N6)-threonylcarbamoyltransferase complex ATPase subunit type 1 TsaE n=1 Tax=Verrucomicrobium sp. GAS474 TaxID=1882831 RepID=UPI00087954E2|nr:tRNA (adenosine(37)-N6)-threonylcarbamoyltransferase complex ATPase subunit type 1 TsaE [Verrucomicrobium sp. GAS474]SDU02115.1 tRNA threonylcarbamoyladenosine biosynthesis protein TsaE [Verrucomicrobium sp. GAS474]